MTEPTTSERDTGLETLGPDELTRAALRELVEQAHGPVVTIAHRADRAAVDAATNDTPLKNGLREAREALEARGDEDTDGLLASIEKLLRDGRQGVLDGEVLHVWPSGARRHRTAFEVEGRVEVGDAPLVTPLLPGMTMAGAFAVLGLSQGSVRLLRATKTTVAEVDLEAHGIPTEVEGVMTDAERPEVSAHEGGRAGDPAVFHGHFDERFEEVITERLFRQVDQGVRRLIGDRTPVVLAGIDKHRAHFQRISGSLTVLDEGVGGDPGDRRPDEFRDAAWPIAAAALRAPVDRALASFGDEAAVGRASADLAEVVRAAHTGRVATLLVGEGLRAWGVADGVGVDALRTGDDDRQPGDEDLVDRAARWTLLNGGEAYAIEPDELPGTPPLAALFRF
ncbi:hypothetical protein ER308_03755 [Egibacter rhizosphaerae]|uniref:Uncharacterized protein n=1 Tax=Egibacter rhizosphaerae TaxID=1670831 RepID=A0A411YC22_9ACTN|nr:hypothetical protein [Egibacter rhizosphaerae]QBI18750.1 hypothetical protein ER308_03755 [Egibacter rhizosphaerae]